MKQRVTYLLPEGNSIDLADIKVGPHGLSYSKAHQASEEWRLTLGLHELPEELKLVLETCHEVHVRFVLPQNELLVPPLVSRLPPGLHLRWTPKDTIEDVAFHYLIKNLLGDGSVCSSLTQTCSELPFVAQVTNGRASYQYYHYSPDIRSNFIKTFAGEMCDANTEESPFYDTCWNSLLELADASSIDFDFGHDKRLSTLTARWGKEGANTTVLRKRDFHPELAEGDTLEVGVLESQQGKKEAEISLGGYLTVIGEDDRPKQTFFSLSSRHQSQSGSSAATFTTSFEQPTGLHPKLQITLSRRLLIPPKDTCSLHAYMTIPSMLFIDRYQLSDRLFLDSQNLVALNSLTGEQDLEAPNWVVDRWGSVALVQLAVPNSQEVTVEKDWTSTIPMHLRYMNGPSNSEAGSSEVPAEVPWPTVFWACQAEEGVKLSNNPFDRRKLGYDDLFESNTLFYQIPPAASVRSTVLDIKIPVLAERTGGMVQAGTLIAVATGFLWVCWQLSGATKLKMKELNKGQRHK